MESCESGLIGSPGKTVSQQWDREFESLTLRSLLPILQNITGLALKRLADRLKG
jgi:hypothetical protein